MNTERRKAGKIQTIENTRNSSSNADRASYIEPHTIPLMETVTEKIVRSWRRGLSISYLAKDQGLTVRQTEAIIWHSVTSQAPARVLQMVGRAVA